MIFSNSIHLFAHFMIYFYSHHVSRYRNMHILFKKFSIRVDNSPSNSQSLSNKNPNSKHKKPSWTIGQGCPRDITGYCCCPWLPTEVESESLLLKLPWISDTRPRGSWAVTDLNVSSLGTSFRDTWRHNASFQREQTNNSPIQLQCLWSTSTTNRMW